jgi:hypothetical protein
MKCFVWAYADKVSDSYHSGGGALAIAKDEERAREILNAMEGCSIRPDEMPDHVFGVDDDTPELALVFPDAGGC